MGNRRVCNPISPIFALQHRNMRIILCTELKSVKQIPRYGFSPKSGRCHAHCLILNVVSIKSSHTITEIKFNLSCAFSAWFIALLVAFSSTVIWGVGGVVTRFHPFSHRHIKLIRGRATPAFEKIFNCRCLSLM